MATYPMLYGDPKAGNRKMGSEPCGIRVSRLGTAKGLHNRCPIGVPGLGRCEKAA